MASDRREVRTRQILEAAEAVFGRAGYWAARTEDVAAEVGITQPALYRYFPSKRELFLAALALRQDEIAASYRSALGSQGSAVEKIRSVAEATIELTRRYPHMARLRLQASALAATDEEMRPLIRGTIELMQAAHAGLLRQAIADGEVPADVDPDLTANVLVGQAFLLYLGQSLEHPGSAPDAARSSNDHCLDVLIRRRAPGKA